MNSPALDDSSPATVSVQPWGHTRNGAPASLCILRNQWLTVTLTNFGARITGIRMHDSAGGTDVCLGFPTLDGYERDVKTFMGATVGRFANRIAHGRFILNGQSFQVPINDALNALHGGTEGFDRLLWQVSTLPSAVEFALLSPDGDMGFPGELSVQVRYTLQANALRIDYTAATTLPTVINLSNHAYFNLAGEAAGTVLDQQLYLAAGHFTPVDPSSIPTGDIAPVAGTPFDFRSPVAIGAHLGDPDPQLLRTGGYDHNFVLDRPLPLAGQTVATVIDPAGGRRLQVETTEPGIQFYSGNFLDGSLRGHTGEPYQKHAGFCLETQHFPDSPNHPQFPSTTLTPGETWRSHTLYRFDHCAA